MGNMKGAQRHFARVASVYDRFRNTDPDVVESIITHLPQNRRPLDVADVGCGTGRYSDLLAARLNGYLRLLCCDYSGAMLSQCHDRMGEDYPTKPFRFCRLRADHMPFRNGSLDGVVTFNAIHHFQLDQFISESARILRPGGLLAIYTRTPEQNMRTVWGQHFPGFAARETRLCPRVRLQDAITRLAALHLEDVREITHRRTESRESLLERARNFHYSTFALYPPDEFAQAIDVFAERLKSLGNGTIEHSAENTLILARRTDSRELSTDITP